MMESQPKGQQGAMHARDRNAIGKHKLKLGAEVHALLALKQGAREISVLGWRADRRCPIRSDRRIAGKIRFL